MNGSAPKRSRLATIAGLLAVVAAGALYWNLTRDTAPTSGVTTTSTGTGSTPVILYLIDTLRADHLALYGYGKPTSSNLNALAADSVVFERAYATAPWTLPSLTSLLTSSYPCEHGVVKRGLKLGSAYRTLPEIMAGAGYSTAAYYANPFAGPSNGLDRGYAVSELRFKAVDSSAPQVDAYLQQVATRPFFLYVHTMEVHQSFLTPHEYMRDIGHVSIDDRERYRAYWWAYRMFLHVDDRANTRPGTSDASAGVAKALNDLNLMRDKVTLLYDSAVRHADANLGEVVAVLKKRGVWDKAVFIVTADHGEELADHGGWFHDQSVYEELIHVPLLIHFPGGAHGGQRIGQHVSLLDLKPTVLELIGKPGECDDCRGTSLLSLVDGRNGSDYRPIDVPAVRMNRNAYYKQLRVARGDDNIVVRDNQWKAIWDRDPKKLELYDLTTDPGEKRDLSGSEQERASRLATRADDWFTQCNAQLRAPTDAAVDARTDERLRALGYLR